MTAIAIQAAIGSIGSKATTELSYSFASMVNTGPFQYGANKDGIHLLNSGETDDGNDYSRTFTLATTDLGDKHPKRGRFLYVGIDTDAPFTVSIKFDDQAWRDYTATPKKTGLQKIRVPVGRDGFGRYLTIKITSTSRFRIDSIEGLFIVRSLGVTGY